jgi:deoxyribodipyrimidine photo-lyase
MDVSMIHPERVHHLNCLSVTSGDFVLYWMESSQRAEWNHALEYAVAEANRLRLPLIAIFFLTDSYPAASRRHYTFMFEGLQEAARGLSKRGIQLVAAKGSPGDGLRSLAKHSALVVTDFGYTRVQRTWREQAAEVVQCEMVAVESDVVVPVQSMYPKEAWSAAVLRRRTAPKLGEWLIPVRPIKLQRSSLGVAVDIPGRVSIESPMKHPITTQGVPIVRGITGGAREARRRLRRFIKHKLAHYDRRRNDPNAGMTSGLSPYLHFGHISPIEIALEVQSMGGTGAEVFLEELIIRRELSMNFVWYNDHYDTFDSLPSWAKQTLHKHSRDKREFCYSRDQWEQAATHDPYWNAAQKELLSTGRIHGYMRMYWGKKILEWSPTPEEAYATAVFLNDKYQLDGRDPNGYAGIAWCFGKHDRPWIDRPVFGMVRYMNAEGLRRKFDADEYVRRINTIVQ